MKYYPLVVVRGVQSSSCWQPTYQDNTLTQDKLLVTIFEYGALAHLNSTGIPRYKDKTIARQHYLYKTDVGPPKTLGHIRSINPNMIID